MAWQPCRDEVGPGADQYARRHDHGAKPRPGSEHPEYLTPVGKQLPPTPATPATPAAAIPARRSSSSPSLAWPLALLSAVLRLLARVADPWQSRAAISCRPRCSPSWPIVSFVKWLAAVAGLFLMLFVLLLVLLISQC